MHYLCKEVFTHVLKTEQKSTKETWTKHTYNRIYISVYFVKIDIGILNVILTIVKANADLHVYIS